MKDTVDDMSRAGAERPAPRPGAPADAGRGFDPARRRAGRLGLLLLPGLLGACGAPSGGTGASAQKEPTRLDIAIGADRDLNTDTKGRGAPLLLRVFELKSDVAFQEADFFALQNNAKAVLGPDLLAVDQFIVRPGEQREIKRESHPETTAIGIFAGYRDLPQSVWRVVHRLPPAPEAGWYRMVVPSHKAALRIELQAHAVVVTDMQKKPRPTQFADESPKQFDKAPPDAAVELPEGPSQAASKAPAHGGGKLLRRPE